MNNLSYSLTVTYSTTGSHSFLKSQNAFHLRVTRERQWIFQSLSPLFLAMHCALTPLLDLATSNLSQLFHKLLLSYLLLVVFFLDNQWSECSLFPFLFRVINIHRLIFFRDPNTSSFTLQFLCPPPWVITASTYSPGGRKHASQNTKCVCLVPVSMHMAWGRVRDRPREQHPFLHF